MIVGALLRLVVLALVVAFAVATAVLFVFPSDDSPARSDAVVVLAGGREERLAEGLRLVRGGLAPVLVISDGEAPDWPEGNRLCRGGQRFEVLCFRSEPYSTRGEAREVTRLAEERGWKSVTVVTSSYHVFRARLVFERCFDGELRVVGARPRFGLFVEGVAYEWPKLIYAVTLARGC